MNQRFSTWVQKGIKGQTIISYHHKVERDQSINMKFLVSLFFFGITVIVILWGVLRGTEDLHM